MLHLVFNEKGIQRIGDMIRPSDKMVQFSKNRILLVDINNYLSLAQDQSKPTPSCASELEGQVINQRELAAIINDADAIKSTY